MSLEMQTSANVLTEVDVAGISADVWGCFLGAQEDFGPGTSETSLGEGAYVASVEITGPWNGRVVLELTAESAEAATRLMFGRPEVSAADVIDAVGELVNMIGGNLKGLFPPPSGLGLPLVYKGTGALTAGRDLVATCSADFTWVGQPVRVSVWEWSQQTEG